MVARSSGARDMALQCESAPREPVKEDLARETLAGPRRLGILL